MCILNSDYKMMKYNVSINVFIARSFTVCICIYGRACAKVLDSLAKILAKLKKL